MQKQTCGYINLCWKQSVCWIHTLTHFHNTETSHTNTQVSYHLLLAQHTQKLEKTDTTFGERLLSQTQKHRKESSSEYGTKCRLWLEPISANVIRRTHAISLRDWILMPAVFQCGSTIWQEASPDAYQCLDSYCSPSAAYQIPIEIIHASISNMHTHWHTCTVKLFSHVCTAWDPHTHTHKHWHSSICFYITAY